MKQGGTPPTGKWIGSPLGGVKAPEAIVLPDAAMRFSASAERLSALSEGHPMAEWLAFVAALSQAQHVAVTTLPALSPIEQTSGSAPPLSADKHRRNPAWRDGLFAIFDAFDGSFLSGPARGLITDVQHYSTEKIDDLADKFLGGTLQVDEVGAAFYIAAALQVYFTRLAGLDRSELRLQPTRGICPCCGSTPVAGVITASGSTPGSRYLHCSLCSTAWNHVRAICITCGGSGGLSLKGIEGDNGAVKAETCDDCRTYSKMLYQAKDMSVDPYADDFASMGLDLLVAEAGWVRHAPNPLLLIAQATETRF